MNLHYAGVDGGDLHNNLLIEMQVKNRLESYWTLKKKAPSSKQFNHLLDSGGFVARTKGVPIDVKEYAKYINKHHVLQAFELDTNDPKETQYNRDYLCNECPAKIIPVFHYSDFEKSDKKLLFEFMDNFEYISVGGVAGEGLGTKHERALYDFVFSNTKDKIKVHGLGITALPMLKRYPWYSVDSTSWLSAERFGNFRSVNDEHEVEWRRTEKFYLSNTRREIEFWNATESYITNLWIQKGVIWD